MAALEAYVPGALVWFTDKDEGWISGSVTSKKVDGDDVTLEFKDDKDKVSWETRREGRRVEEGEFGGSCA